MSFSPEPTFSLSFYQDYLPKYLGTSKVNSNVLELGQLEGRGVLELSVGAAQHPDISPGWPQHRATTDSTTSFE